MNHRNEFLATYGNAEHATHAINSGDDELIYAGSKNQHLPKEHMEKLVNDKDVYVGHLGLSLNPSTPSNLVDKLVHHRDGEVQRNALIHKNVSKSVVHNALRNPSVWADAHEKIVKFSPHVTKEDLNYVIDSKTRHFDTRIKDSAFNRLEELSK